MRGGLMTIEQTRLRKHQRSAARGQKLCAALVHARDPVQQAAVERLQIPPGAHHDIRHEHDVGPGDIGDTVLRKDADAGDQLQRAGFGGDDPRLEHWRVWRHALPNVHEPAGGPQRVEYAIDDRGIAFGKYHQADVHGLVGHGLAQVARFRPFCLSQP
jgi:hypothetical protein